MCSTSRRRLARLLGVDSSAPIDPIARTSKSTTVKCLSNTASRFSFGLVHMSELLFLSRFEVLIDVWD